ncbi:MAG: protein-export chaperone SecB [Gammaproteobacteria bacterium]|nr:protein-export chaperone SecB [Gammaproteobacteria bacterium]
MSENENVGAAHAAPQQQFGIQRIYTKDISFETPNTPTIFTTKWEPEMNVEINSTATLIQEGLYEVVLRLTITAKVAEQTAYLVEVKQAGIFNVSGFDESGLGHMLHSFCPNILFPYGREVVSDLVTRGSFPQMLLAPVNFDAIYAQHLQQRAKQAEAEAGAAPSIH